jgi:hypothetical protein
LFVIRGGNQPHDNKDKDQKFRNKGKVSTLAVFPYPYKKNVKNKKGVM